MATILDPEAASESLFSPPLWEQRRSIVNRLMVASHCNIVADLGCGEGSLCAVFCNSSQFRDIIGVDLDRQELDVAYINCSPTHTDSINLRELPMSINLYNGSIDTIDSRLRSVEAVACCEVIEHVQPEILPNILLSILGYIHPRLAIFTTPNKDFNVLFPDMNLDPSDPKFRKFRHSDHKFEWTRNEFRSWATAAAIQYGYHVVFTGVGILAKEMYNPSSGHCTQIAVFIRKSGRRENANVIGETIASRIKEQKGYLLEEYEKEKSFWEETIKKKKLDNTYNPDEDGTEYYSIEGPLLHYCSLPFPYFDSKKRLRSSALVDFLAKDIERVLFGKYTNSIAIAKRSGGPVPKFKSIGSLINLSEIWESLTIRQQFVSFQNLVEYSHSPEIKGVYEVVGTDTFIPRDFSTTILDYHNREIFDFTELLDLVDDTCFELSLKEDVLANRRPRRGRKLTGKEFTSKEKIAFTDKFDGIASDDEKECDVEQNIWYNSTSSRIIKDLKLKIVVDIKPPELMLKEDWSNYDDIGASNTRMEDGEMVLDEKVANDLESNDESTNEPMHYIPDHSSPERPRNSARQQMLLNSLFDELDRVDTLYGKDEKYAKEENKASLAQAGFNIGNKLGWKEIELDSNERDDLLNAITKLTTYREYLPKTTPVEFIMSKKSVEHTKEPFSDNKGYNAINSLFNSHTHSLPVFVPKEAGNSGYNTIKRRK